MVGHSPKNNGWTLTHFVLRVQQETPGRYDDPIISSNDQPFFQVSEGDSRYDGHGSKSFFWGAEEESSTRV